MPEFQSADVRLHYRLDGPECAPLVVLSNSLGTAMAMWEPQIGALVPQFRVLRYDSRGHGRSSVPSGPYTIEQMGRDVLALLDSVGADRIHFCGLSMGGMVGMWLAAHARERIDKLVLANTAARMGAPERYEARIATVNERGMDAIVDAVLAAWFTPPFLALQGPEVQATRAMLLATPAAGYAAACAAVRDMDERAGLAHIAAPTLVIAGAHDAATPPADGRFIMEHVRGARLVELAASHLSNLEQAAAFSAALADFLLE